MGFVIILTEKQHMEAGLIAVSLRSRKLLITLVKDLILSKNKPKNPFITNGSILNTSHKLHMRKTLNTIWNQILRCVVWCFLLTQHSVCWFRSTQRLRSVHLCWFLRDSHVKVRRQATENWSAFSHCLFCKFFKVLYGPQLSKMQTLQLRFAYKMLSSKLDPEKRSASSSIVLLES